MPGYFSPASAGLRQRHGGSDETRRPIASALPLGSPHVAKIDESHERCQALGLSRIERPEFSPLGRSDLGVVRDRNQRLYNHAAPVMEMLYDQIVNTQSMVVLTDATGTILHSIGDDDFLARACKVALQPGVNWSESSKGTNAVGTALIEEIPTLVHADEHYLHANQFLTCSAAPILDPRGNILGVLDVSGDRHGFHQHTMGLVKMSARMIENHWLTDDYRNVMRLHFHSRVEFIGTLMEGILAVSQDGKFVGANRGALEQLGLSGAALRMHTLGSLLGTTVAALVERFRSPLATPVQVVMPNGRQFHVYARFNWPVWHSLGDGASGPPAEGAPATEEPGVPALRREPPGRAPAAPGPGPAGADRGGLGSLSTGDAQVGAVVDKIRRVLNRDIPILVLGETGTGKELLARAIHQDSDRAKQPFVAVNCASIPDTLIEAELFGYEEGAFTGARRKGATGRIVQANGGTLFLDEIGDMPIGLQAHLLRVLQERQVTPLGSGKSVAVDVTLVCATHRNLREMIEQKTFREDLYYRLNGLAVRLPPLRERSDLMALVERILERESPGRRLRLDPEVLRLFQAYQWPGNVRQLFNVLRTAVVMAASDAVITRDHLSDDFLEDARRAAQVRAVAADPVVAPLPAAPAWAPPEPLRPPEPGATAGWYPATAPAASSPVAPLAPWGAGHGAGAAPAWPGVVRTPSPPSQPGSALPAGAPAPVEAGQSLEDIEIRTIQRVLDEAGGNISVAAKRLGISRNTIYRKLRWNGPR
jgi:transcriptional regulator of acetoin/glycerol metabolism